VNIEQLLLSFTETRSRGKTGKPVEKKRKSLRGTAERKALMARRCINDRVIARAKLLAQRFPHPYDA